MFLVRLVGIDTGNMDGWMDGNSAHLIPSLVEIPFTLMLSPRCASVRMSSQFEMVNDVPPPPVDEVSRGSRDVTAALISCLDWLHRSQRTHSRSSPRGR